MKNDDSLIISTKMIESLKSFEPIKKQLGDINSSKRSHLLVKAVVDDSVYELAKKNLPQLLESEGIHNSSIEDSVFISMIEYLRARKAIIDNPGIVSRQMTNKSTETGSMHNFDNKRSSITKVESHAIHERGTKQSKSTSESAFSKKEFKGLSMIDSEHLIKYADELQKSYFPGQPLITPELIEKIRTDLGDN